MVVDGGLQKKQSSHPKAKANGTAYRLQYMYGQRNTVLVVKAVSQVVEQFLALMKRRYFHTSISTQRLGSIGFGLRAANPMSLFNPIRCSCYY